MANAINNIFWNSTDRRLRAFWRVLLQGCAWLGIQIVVGLFFGTVIFVVAIVTGWISTQDLLASDGAGFDLMNHPLVRLILQIVILLTTLSTVWLVGRILDRRRFVDFGFHLSRRWWMDLGFGLFLGGFLMSVVFLVELAAGWVSVAGFLVTSPPGGIFPLAILMPLGLFLCVGISEEVFSRGYQIKNLAEGMNGERFGAAGAILGATVLTSIFFGFLHIANPNTTWISTLNLMTAGVFLALGYILTGELALPIGLHITWNFFQGNVFGFSVSGLEPVAARFLEVRQAGPELLTGGAFGPEGGLIGVGAMLLGCLMIFLWVRITRGKISLANTLAESPGKKLLSNEVHSV